MLAKKVPSYKEIIKDEYKKCAQDCVHFMKKYCLIQHPDPARGKIYFNLYDFQEDVLNNFQTNRLNIILKSRQLGLSTLVAGYILHSILFHEDYNALVIATKQTVAKNLVTKVSVMYDNLPSWLRIASVEDNKLSLRLVNGSQVKAVASSPDAGRSEALSLLVLDEAAFIEKATDIWTSAQSTLAEGGSAIVLSTPNGVGNLFHKLYKEAVNGQNQFHPIRLRWDVHPKRDQNWRDGQTELLGEQMSAQECDADFISSGYSVVDGATLKYYEETYVSEPVEKRGFDTNLWIWKYPDYSRNYLISADVARGDGADNSACHVLDIETMEQVAEYVGKLGTDDFGNLLTILATEYNNALLVVENANIGWAVLQTIIDRGYNNLFYTYKNDPYMDEAKHLRKSYDLVDKSKMVPGFTTSSKTRPLVVSKIETYFREKAPIIHSSRTISELEVFSWINGKAQAKEGFNDDTVMALGIGLWVRDTAVRLKQQGLDLNRKAISHIHKTVFKDNQAPPQARQQWEMQLGKEVDSLKWLLGFND